MTSVTSVEDRPGVSSRQLAADALLAAVVVSVAVWIHVTGLDAVPANRAPDALSVTLTVAAVAPLTVRRVRPLLVMIACLPGPLLLVAGHYSVGATPLGVVAAFYTTVAWGARREARAAVPVLLASLGSVALLRPIDLSVEGTLVEVAFYLGGWIIGTGVRERREFLTARVSQARREIEIAHQQAELERERASRATAEERLRITRELHDVLGHAFSVTVVQAGAAEQLLDIDPDATRAALRQIAATGRSSLADIRRVLAQVRDDDDPGPVAEASPGLADVPALVERVRAAGLPIRLHLSCPEASMPGPELAAYRVVQEALTNCLKHASASVCEVTVEMAGGVMRVSVRDDGRGPDGFTAAGHGLTGMRERVTAYGGALQTGPAPAGGYWVVATIPLAAGEAVA